MKRKLANVVELPLSGWGRYPVVNSYLQRPEKIDTCRQILQDSDEESVLARGLGRSYGDAALNRQGYTLLAERLNRLLAFDEQMGILTCEAGVTLQEILQVFVPRGWFLAVTPGTKFVTVGGAIAFDVHGKNHHRDGSFGHWVRRFQLMLASGEIVECSREQNSDLFWATIGGMGLTGMITEAEIALHPIETAYLKQHNIKVQNLDEALEVFDEYEPEYQFSVAWIDCLATGRALGRSILMFGNWATPNDLAPSVRPNPLQLKPKRRFRIPMDAPAGLLNRYTVQNFNRLYYAKQRSRHLQTIVDYDTFFYPLDFLWDWNRLYGKKGFVQYQCVFPPDVSREGLIQMLQRCAQKGWGSFLAVLKRFGTHEPVGWLSFPMPGYTLTLDIPLKPGLWEFLDQLDRLVLNCGGRVYLAKDARLSPEAFRAMYPQFEQWLALKSKIDPHNRFTSALAQRLQIEPTLE